MTVQAGVVGWPIAHSLSPLIHNTWIAAAGLDAAYVAHGPETPDQFAALLDQGRAGRLRGLNVTAPYKEQAFAAADRVSDAARLVGSANLLVFEDGRIAADSTDGHGLMNALAEQAPALQVAGRAVVILGAGGAARAVQATFDDERGWAGYGKRNFQLVTDPEQAELTIYITSPDTSNELCQPLDVASKWNCRVGDRVVLNSDRWKYMTPTYDDLGVYRSYLVNHEVGHFLGQGHVGCPKEGAVAPVMMQQSIELDGCVPNAWPRDAD